MLDGRDAVSVIEALLKHARTLLNCISHSGSPSLSPILLHFFHLFFSVPFSCPSPSLSPVLPRLFLMFFSIVVCIPVIWIGLVGLVRGWLGCLSLLARGI